MKRHRHSNQSYRQFANYMSSNVRRANFYNRSSAILNRLQKNQSFKDSHSKIRAFSILRNYWKTIDSDYILLLIRYLTKMNITLSEDKENINPNIMTSNHFDSYSLNKTKQPKISRFKAFDKDWRKKIMNPSSKEV